MIIPHLLDFCKYFSKNRRYFYVQSQENRRDQQPRIRLHTLIQRLLEIGVYDQLQQPADFRVGLVADKRAGRSPLDDRKPGFTLLLYIDRSAPIALLYAFTRILYRLALGYSHFRRRRKARRSASAIPHAPLRPDRSLRRDRHRFLSRKAPFYPHGTRPKFPRSTAAFAYQ